MVDDHHRQNPKTAIAAGARKSSWVASFVVQRWSLGKGLGKESDSHAAWKLGTRLDLKFFRTRSGFVAISGTATGVTIRCIYQLSPCFARGEVGSALRNCLDPWMALVTVFIRSKPGHLPIHRSVYNGIFIYGYGSIPIDTLLMGWTSINPSYFDVNYRGTRFWHTAIFL